MSYIENTFYLGMDHETEQGECDLINQSSMLDALAQKLRPSVLQGASDVYLPMETKSKARMVDLLSGLSAIYKLVRQAHNSPVFIVQHHSSWESADGFYFFIGTQEEIKQKLLKLSEDRYNLVENNRW